MHNLQREHRGEITFPILKRILFTYRVLCKTLYWNIRAFVSKVVLQIRKKIFFQLKLDDSKRFSKYSCAVGLTVFASTRVKYNSLLVSLLKLQI